jgi:rubrerythrin
MAVFFKSGELYRMAAAMERTGIAYYKGIAENTKDAGAKAVFKYLEEAEKRHLRTFKKLWNQSAKSSPPESYRGEYANYLRTLLKDLVFPTSGLARSRAARSTPLSALNTGIKAEKESILFYSGLLDVVHQDHKSALIKILGDEKRHLRRLMDYKYQSGCFK